MTITTTPANHLRFLASELIDEAHRHDGEQRQKMNRAAQQCAAASITIGNLAKRSCIDHETIRKTIAAAEAIIEASTEALVAATLLRTPELHTEGTTS